MPPAVICLSLDCCSQFFIYLRDVTLFSSCEGGSLRGTNSANLHPIPKQCVLWIWNETHLQHDIGIPFHLGVCFPLVQLHMACDLQIFTSMLVFIGLGEGGSNNNLCWVPCCSHEQYVHFSCCLLLTYSVGTPGCPFASFGTTR